MVKTKVALDRQQVTDRSADLVAADFARGANVDPDRWH